jgi:23S rRNA pseudouridine955/2504/2580 synthase
VEQRIIGGGAGRPAVQNVRIDGGSAGQRLDNFLIRTLKGVPKTHLYRVIRSGEVRVNSGRASAETRLAEGDWVRIPPVRVAERDESDVPAREFAVVHEDEHLLAIDKPAGVAVHGGSGESFGVIEQLRRSRPRETFLELVHRLDKETSGLLLVARTRRALLSLQNDLRTRAGERAIGKTYAALVLGAWPAATQVIDAPLHKFLDADGARRVRVAHGGDDEAGRRSITLVRVAEPFADRFTLLRVTIKTGRTHQIRVHLAHAGHPVAGDPKYGDFAANRALARGAAVPGLRFQRMFLHASALRFVHPASGQRVELQAPLPEPCARLLDALREGR